MAKVAIPPLKPESRTAMSDAAAPAAGESRQSFPEFVGLMACMMAMTAFSIDIMLPGLPAIGAYYAVADPNAPQLVVFCYLAGFALGQPLFGPLSDQYGRRPLLFFGMAVYVLATFAAFLAPSFEAMLGARALQGFGSAAGRILAVAIVRDRFAGRAMAEVMSFVMMVFIFAPVIAPTIGAGMIAMGDWKAAFYFLFLLAAIVVVWAYFRLDETLPAHARQPVSAGSLLHAIKRVATTRQTVGYMCASGFVFGALMSYVAASEQIFADVYGFEKAFPYLFGASALSIAAASLFNARVVEKIGMRRLSQGALLMQVAICALVAVSGFPEHPPFWLMMVFVAIMLFGVGIIGPNFNALAMEPMGDIAGTASSALGFFTTATSAAFGAMVAQSFDGTMRPMFIGMTALAVGALLTVAVAEKGRLFEASV